MSTVIRKEPGIKDRILCVVGPTASGKTALAVALAKRLDGEIISCDSMQIYDRLFIGTARPTPEEMDGIPHHLIGFADPRVPFSCRDFADAAVPMIQQIRGRGKLPIVCGGTGLYLDALLRPIAPGPGSDPAIRRELEEEVASAGIDKAYSRLLEVDPASCVQIHPNNTRRVIRALEIYRVTGIPKSVWDERSRENPDRFPHCIIGLTFHDRGLLQKRIDLRVDRMMKAGLLEEVSSLLSAGYLPSGSTASQAIGYKELIAYLEGKGTLEDAVEQIRTATRQYAKRQMTWFRRNPSIHWIFADSPSVSDREDGVLREALSIWNSND
ncbi:MAG: tRNA (adenosine(37)-N6)-dimethylallyltransferase MiaA [Clostridia bacterium]|nr:tRNA (adenosine(37)-N6)-dimethylallyltransferase MiaA [Clostridia bacterium]